VDALDVDDFEMYVAAVNEMRDSRKGDLDGG
jgi:hypothetical protein